MALAVCHGCILDEFLSMYGLVGTVGFLVVITCWRDVVGTYGLVGTVCRRSGVLVGIAAMYRAGGRLDSSQLSSSLQFAVVAVALSNFSSSEQLDATTVMSLSSSSILSAAK